MQLNSKNSSDGIATSPLRILKTIVSQQMVRPSFKDSHFSPSNFLMNNYIVRSYRDVIVITKFAITKYAIRRASKAKSIVMY